MRTRFAVSICFVVMIGCFGFAANAQSPFVINELPPPKDWDRDASCRVYIEDAGAEGAGIRSREANADSREWILVSEAVARLPFINNLKSLFSFAKSNPNRLRLRPDPKHKRRRQAFAADVLPLEIDRDKWRFDALDKSGHTTIRARK